MSLPVSQYEALLAEVRGLRRKAQHVQQLAKPLLQGDNTAYGGYMATDATHLQHDGACEPLDYTMESLLQSRHSRISESSNFDHGATSSVEGDATCSEDEYCGVRKSSTKMSVSSEPVPSKRNIPSSMYHGTWPVEKNMWNSEPASLGHSANHKGTDTIMEHQIEVNSVMSFASSSGGVPLDRVLGSPERGKWSSQHLEIKIDVVHSLLSMLGSQDHIDMGETLLALSTCPESCLAMRQSGCIPLLVQLVQSDKDSGTRKKASQALHNLVNSQPDEKIRKRESRVLKFLEHCRGYTEALRCNLEYEKPEGSSSEELDVHPLQTVAHLMKLSFDEGHRQAICQLGGIHTISSLVEVEHTMHGGTAIESQCILMRRYACMALTNLTFGDSGNKALLCSYREFMRALVVQLQSSSDELRQVTASVLRNLSWRADSTSKEILREVGSVTGLMKAAMLDNKENTLKSILSALWNLSAHCTENKSEICAVEGALGFLVDMLTYKTPTKSLAIVENSGGILRNISSQIAVREDYREVLRNHNCLQILLEQLKSPSLTIVSNACGTLWNLSAKCAMDQEILWRLGAPTMLRSLNHSKHKMIAMGSSAALKNLLTARPQQSLPQQLDSTALALDLPTLPTLGARKKKALLQDLDQNLTETYDNIEKDSPVKKCEKGSAVSDFVPDSRHKSSRNTFEYIDDRLTNNFASLNINEATTSYVTDFRSKSGLIQNYGSSSLPYMSPPIKRSNPCTYIPVRNKFSDCGYDDEIDITDQPIDYSRKYSETKLPNNQVSNASIKKEADYSYKEQKDEENFGIYAETDLDQPTDYSLRYAEDDSDSDICVKIDKNEPQEYVQDTVKTYCTEDTPYETPFNFSTATSMSDLRVDDKPIIDNDKVKENASHSNKENNDNAEEKERCSTEDISEIDNQKKCMDKIPKSELSSGLMSPEKPVNYCEEGTPGYFSRVSSFGSLNSIPANETLKDIKHSNTLPQEKQDDSLPKEIEKTPPKIGSEAKAVKFERVVNYAEQTPLMFSRSSSLASLDSIEQHSIHDDRSSVVSDLSRLTSGIVSPSELPDSPTQTVPPSPKPRKTSMEFPSTSKLRNFEGPTHSSVRVLHKPSIFEDNVTKFKEENTPVQFSTATSLSSLTIDDHEETGGQVPESNTNGRKADVSEENVKPDIEETEKKDTEKDTGSDINDVFTADTEDEGDEDILAECINMGMQTNRANQVQSPVSTSVLQNKLPHSNYKYHSKAPLSSGIPLPRHSSPRSTVIHGISRQSLTQDDARSYSNEESLTVLDRTDSHSNIEFETRCKKGDYSSDDSSNLSGDNDNILAECIQSGMPKAKKEIPKSSIKLPSTLCLPRRNNFQTDHPCNQQSLPLTKYALTSSTSNPRREANKPNIDSEKRAGRREQSLPPYLSAGDELENYAVENSPCHFSLRSSLSDLTVDGSVAGLKKKSAVPSDQQKTYSVNSDPSSSQFCLPGSYEENATGRHRSGRESLSSISVESLGSIEAEQALLEQCISSGKPKNNSISPTKNLEFPRSDNRTSMGKQQSRSRPTSETDSNSKNVNAASVAGSTALQANEACPDPLPTAAAGVGSNLDPKIGTKTSGIQDPAQKVVEKIETSTENLTGSLNDMSPDKYSLTEEISFKEITKNGFNNSFTKILGPTYENLVIEERLARSCEESKIVDNRMLDPDAMIESLDRFTAELVSQASHLTKDEDKFKASTTDSTWNEDSSPNEATFPSLSGSVPNVITFSNEDDSNKDDEDLLDGPPDPSNDFSSINTSTMTDSTLIAMEASKMATVFKNEAEMSLSMTSLELDHVPPPSNLNSLTNSAVGLPRSPKLITRKKSLPAGLMVKKALSNSLNYGSSLESLENHSLLDNINPPSDLLLDMDNSITSIASLPLENCVRTDFLINGLVNKELQNGQHPIFNIKQPFTSSNYECSDLENINPPSLFNEITDFCNSLADINTDLITREDDVTQVADVTLADDTVTFTQDENTEMSVTPLNSNASSAENTPKKQKNLSKSMMTKQRRVLARERFKTYTIAAEMVLRDSLTKEDLDTSQEHSDHQTQVKQFDAYVGNTTATKETLTPREKRQLNRSRFETQVLDKTAISSLQPLTPPPTPPAVLSSEPHFNSDSCSSSPTQSPARTKLSIRRNFLQKRFENKDRFRTQTLSESSFSPNASVDSPPLSAEIDMHFNLQKEADLVLRTLHAAKSSNDELLECETLSLVSNDDDSEHNSASSVNYRTYHKSWGISQNNIPIITSIPLTGNTTSDLVNNVSCNEHNDSDVESLGENDQTVGKPKIVKPTEKPCQEPQIEEVPKAIRGRRKPLYSKSNLNNKIAPKSIRPTRNVTSNLIKNITSNFKPASGLKPIAYKQIKPPSKSPAVQTKSMGGTYNRPLSQGSLPKTSPARTPTSKGSPKHLSTSLGKTIVGQTKELPVLERQGTFTKDDLNSSSDKKTTKIPTLSTTRIPTFSSKVTMRNSGSASKNSGSSESSVSSKPPTPRNSYIKTASVDKPIRNSRIYNRSTSADSRDPSASKLQTSPSSHSLKSDSKLQYGAVKKSTVPGLAQRSNSNSSINSNGSTNAKKQVTSKIASLWKKIEDTKKQPPKKDSRKWIQSESDSPASPGLLRSNTFENKDGLILRNQKVQNGDSTKRVSRLGSFVIMDDEDPANFQQSSCNAVSVANVM